MTPSHAIVCNLGCFSDGERRDHEARTREVMSHVERSEAEPDGYTLTFSSALELTQMTRFIADESRCCSFLRFELSGRRLKVHGPAGSRAVLDALLVTYGVIDQSASL